VADRDATVPVARRRLVGGPQQVGEQQNRAPLFFAEKGRIGVVHGFIKKTQKTPPAEIALAQKRMKEMIA
jgi:phage-related protein